MNMNAYHKVFCVVIKYSLSLSASSFHYHIWMHIRKVLLKYSLSLATSSSSTLATSSDCTWQFQFSQCSLWVSSDLWQKFSTFYQVVAFITMMYFSCMRNRCQRWAFYAWVIIILEYGSEWFLLCSFFCCAVFFFLAFMQMVTLSLAIEPAGIEQSSLMYSVCALAGGYIQTEIYLWFK